MAELRPAASVDGLEAAARRELQEAGRLDSLLGQGVIRLAARIDSGADTGSAVASLHRELRATQEAALAGARVKNSRIGAVRDELAERRRNRGA